MKYSIIRNSNYIKFLSTLIIIGIMIGIIIYTNLDTNTKSSVLNTFINFNKNITNKNQNNIIFHILIILFLVITTLTVILYPINIFYLLYESISIGFILASFLHINGILGLLYSLIYILLNKALFMLILLYLNIMSFKVIIRIIKSLLNKDNISVRNLYKNYFKKIIISIITIIILDVLILFLGNKILSIFKFLL